MKTCPVCATPVSGRKKYCAKRCQQMVADRRYRGRRQTPRACKLCGAEFFPIRHSWAVYCCKAHRRLHANRQRSESTNRRRRERYRHDPEYRSRRKRHARTAYLRSKAGQPGSAVWLQARLHAERRAAEQRVDPAKPVRAVLRGP